MATLSAKRQRFVEEYLVDLNATQAAIRAGYSARTAQPQSSELLSIPMIKAAVAAGQAEQTARTEITQDYVLTTIRETIEKCRAIGDYSNPAAVLKGAELLAKHLGMLTDKQSIKLEGSMSHDWTVRVVAPDAGVVSLPEVAGHVESANRPRGRRRPDNELPSTGTDDA